MTDAPTPPEASGDTPNTEPLAAPPTQAGPEAAPTRRLFFARLAAAVRRQDWFVVALEIAIVVLGVVIGFQVTAWGQNQADRTREREYLHALVADLRADTTQIQTARRDAARRAQSTHQILAEIEGEPRLPPVELAVAVEETMWFNFPAYTRTTIAELTSTGNLRLVQDADLRRDLSEYYQTIERLDQWTGNWRRIQMDLEAVLPEVLDIRHREAVTAYINGVPLPPWASPLDVSAEEGDAIRRRLQTHPTYETRLKGMARIHGTLYSNLARIQVKAVDVLQSAEAVAARVDG